MESVFSYDKVKEKYPDSLSQEDFNIVFQNPNHGEVNFQEVYSEFNEFYKYIYALEELDYKNNLLPTEIRELDHIRKEIERYIKQLKEFSIKTANPPQQQRDLLVNNLRNYISQKIVPLEDTLLKLKTKLLFDSKKGNEIEKELSEIKEARQEIFQTAEEANKYLDELKNKLENTQFEKVETGERDLGEAKAAEFFMRQADTHKQYVEEETGWKQSIKNLTKAIYWVIGITIFLYIASYASLFICAIYRDDIDIISAREMFHAFWDVRSGLVLAALLSVLYVARRFAVVNYNREKNLEYQNRDKEHIANSVGLFTSGMPDTLRDKVYVIAAQTLFSGNTTPSNIKENEGRTNISLSATTADLKALNDKS